MKFAEAWAHVASQNSVLKIALSAVSTVAVALAVAVTNLAIKPVPIIERGCTSKTVMAAPAEHTKDEIETFIQTALAQRFDTSVTPSPAFVSKSELKFRIDEQAELKGRNMQQRVLIGRTIINGDDITVDMDRVLKAGTLRSALPCPLKLTLSSTTRNAQNPYGLILEKVSKATFVEDDHENSK